MYNKQLNFSSHFWLRKSKLNNSKTNSPAAGDYSGPPPQPGADGRPGETSTIPQKEWPAHFAGSAFSSRVNTAGSSQDAF